MLGRIGVKATDDTNNPQTARFVILNVTGFIHTYNDSMLISLAVLCYANVKVQINRHTSARNADNSVQSFAVLLLPSSLITCHPFQLRLLSLNYLAVSAAAGAET
jgi:hypothetical protein